MQKTMHYLLLLFFFLSFAGCQENTFTDDIITEFIVLDEILKNSHINLDSIVKRELKKMEHIALTKVQYMPLVQKAKQIKALSETHYQFIDSLKQALSNLANTEKQLTHKNSKEIVAKVLLNKNSNAPSLATVLDSKLQLLQQQQVQIIEKLWDNGGIKGSIFVDSSKKEMAINSVKEALDLNSSKDYNPQFHKNKTWEQYTFGDKLIVAVLPILSALQNELKLTTITLISFLGNQIGYITTCGHRSYIVSSSSKPTIRLGETYHTDLLFLDDYQTNQFDLMVNNTPIQTINGKKTYRVKPTTVGEHRYLTKIMLKNKLTKKQRLFIKHSTLTFSHKHYTHEKNYVFHSYLFPNYG